MDRTHAISPLTRIRLMTMKMTVIIIDGYEADFIDAGDEDMVDIVLDGYFSKKLSLFSTSMAV